MLPSVLTSQLQTGVEDFLRTTFPTTTPHFHGMLDRFFERDGSVFKGPYVNVDLPFRHSGHGPDYFSEVPLDFPPYAHQAQAFERLSGDNRQSTLVATGTGSGKTEAFLWPLLDYVRQHKTEQGIKGLLIYPMNALANDQAGRIVRAVDEIDSLHGVRAGLYIGDEEDNPTMTMGAEDVITSRETLRLDPPDVLLTNYKMLDYLLTRPADARLWRYNEPETLQYLVVDELHTFDGAQGTDLACLIRRLKDRVETPTGHLCCIGTSATLGGAEDFGELRSYAHDVFGEPFENGAVIGERRERVEDFLHREKHSRVPGPDALDALQPDAYQTPEAYVRSQASLWFDGNGVPDVTTGEGRVALGQRLRGHRFLHVLLDILEGRPWPVPEVVDELADEIKRLEDRSEEYQCAVLDSFLALLSWARSTVETPHGSELGPFLQVRVQLWLRELRRMVGSIGYEPTLTYWDDLPEASTRDPHLPLVHCLECGAMGWVGIHHQNEARFQDDLKGIYRRFFNDEPTFSFAFPVSETEEIETEGSRHEFCGHDLHFSDPDAEACEACGRDDQLVSVYRPHNRKTTQAGKQIGSRDCPFCGTRKGLSIVGSRAASLTSVLISQLYALAHNEDKKLLTFSDAVQDAAHRAGFFESRTYRFNLRSAIQKVVEDRDPTTLDALQTAVTEHYRDVMDEKEYVSTFIAPDMEWFEEFEALQRTGSFPEGSSLVEDVSRRLRWEVWSEYGFRARTGRTLEKTGSSVAALESDRLYKATSDLLPVLRNEVGNLREIDPQDVRRFLRGIAQHLKNDGAIFHPELGTYVEHGGNYYVLNKRPHMPSYGQSSRLPAFISTVSTNRFDSVLGTGATGTRSWLQAWAIKCFGDVDPMLEGVLDALYRESLGALVRAKILNRTQTNKGNAVWGLSPSALVVWPEVTQLRCERCGHNVSVAPPAGEDWVRTPCLRYQCSGRYSVEDTERNYYRRLYSAGDLQRIVAREHTGLLGREQRQTLERQFKDGGKPWEPNLLSCTPTLELGVDVGQLSSVVLCSVPPAPSNFVQRIGRGGRRSGNALDVTVANGRPHDLYFFEDPEEMIAGDIEPPGVFLGAVEVLVRQYVAYCFDRWVASGVSEEAVPSRLSRVLRGIDDENVFPHTWLSFVEDHEGELFEGFVDLFGEVLGQERVDALEQAIEKEGGIEMRVLERLGEIKRWRRDLHRRSRRLYRKIREAEDGPVTGETEKELEEMRREKTALQNIYQRIGEKNTYNFFTDAGLLPNYAFPESGVTLRSILYRQPKKGGQQVWDEEFVRPAPNAIQELAPGSTFYADGRQVQVDQIDLSGEDTLERWRFCDRCAYMKRVVEEEHPQRSCPRCGSPTWDDQGQEQTLVRLDEVRATTADRKSRIDDSSEGREREFFEGMLQVDFERQDVETAYRIDSQELPFGFEFIEEATFREINFGQPWEQVILEVCGQEVKGQGFRTCPACGRVAVDGDSINHTRSCTTTQENGMEHDPETLFLYREVESEAVRILLPETSFAGTPERVESFKAAFELGLEEYFDGSVDHLKTAIQEGPGDEEIARRRYLVVYDSVPGGTGYLADLLRRKEILLEVLEEALSVLTTCPCTEEEGRDGCYRCLYAYRNHYDMPHTSRSAAVELLEGILDRREDLIEIDSVDQIRVHGVLESELEARFLQRLRELDVEPSRLEKTTIGGTQGYEFTIGDHVYEIEPQVHVGPEEGVVRSCSIDFVLRPQDVGLKPIAVFLDGLQYHRTRIGRDFAQRRALRASGKYYVWSLSWRDVTTQTSYHARNYLRPPTKAFGELLTVMGEKRAQKAANFVGKESFDWLIDLLQQPDPAFWERVALAQALLFARQQSDRDSWLQEAESHLPSPLAGVLAEEARDDEPLLGLTNEMADEMQNPVRTWTAARRSAIEAVQSNVETARRGVVMAFHLDDELVEHSGDFETHWNGFLRLYNLFQFLPRSYPVTSDKEAFWGYEELIQEGGGERISDHVPSDGDVVDVDEQGWKAAFEAARSSPDGVEVLLEPLYEEEAPPPTVSFELQSGNETVAEAELGWPAQEVAVVAPDQKAHKERFEEQDWTVFSLSEVAEDPHRLIDILVEKA